MKNTLGQIVSLFVLCLVLGQSAKAQVLEPVKWQFATKKINDSEAVVLIKADIEEGWHVYSQHVKEGGPLPTSVVFAKSNDYILKGKLLEPKPIVHFEEIFKMDVAFFENQVVFQQTIKLNKPTAVVKGTVRYMVCDDTSCVQDEKSFAITVK